MQMLQTFPFFAQNGIRIFVFNHWSRIYFFFYVFLLEKKKDKNLDHIDFFFPLFNLVVELKNQLLTQHCSLHCPGVETVVSVR